MGQNSENMAYDTPSGQVLYYYFFTLYVQTWSELLEPLVNMIKDDSENKPALLILQIFFF